MIMDSTKPYVSSRASMVAALYTKNKPSDKLVAAREPLLGL